jgi:hypothetical protein
LREALEQFLALNGCVAAVRPGSRPCMKDIDDLIAGFRRFRGAYYGERRALVERLVREGQTPKIMVVACSDSRVDPAIVTDCDPGDPFVVRNVANLVPPYEEGGGYHGTSAALEFAVRCLRVDVNCRRGAPRRTRRPRRSRCRVARWPASSRRCACRSAT